MIELAALFQPLGRVARIDDDARGFGGNCCWFGLGDPGDEDQIHLGRLSSARHGGLLHGLRFSLAKSANAVIMGPK